MEQQESKEDIVTTSKTDLGKEIESKADPSPPLDPRMKLTPEEKEWAQEIKAAAAAIPELDPLTDFMYAQIALVTLAHPDETNLDLTLEKIGQYQQYLRDRNIRDANYPDACRALDKTLRELVPGHFLSFSYHEEKECVVKVIDLTTFHRSVWEDPNNTETFLSAIYFLGHAASPDMTCIRNGVVYLLECSGYDWKHPDMFNRTCLQRTSTHKLVYPVLTKCCFYNASMFLNLAITVAKRILPKHITQRLEVGHQVEGQWDPSRPTLCRANIGGRHGTKSGHHQTVSPKTIPQ